MKPTPKHLRPRWRYLAVEIEGTPGSRLTRSSFERALQDAICQLFGDVGYAETRIRLYAFTKQHHRAEAVIRTKRGSEGITRAGLACIHSLEGAPLRIMVRGISGSVRGCEEKFLPRDQEIMGETSVVFDNKNRYAFKCGDEIDINVNDLYVSATILDT